MFISPFDTSLLVLLMQQNRVTRLLLVLQNYCCLREKANACSWGIMAFAVKQTRINLSMYGGKDFDTYSPRIVTGRRWNARRYGCGEIDALRRECCEERESKWKKKGVRFGKEFYVILAQF